MQSIGYYFKNPWKALGRFAYHTVSMWPDKLYLRIIFRAGVGYPLNLKHPRTFNEKLQWLKFESKKHPEYAMMVDKFRVKKWVAETVGGKYVIPVIADWDRLEDIDWDSLPNSYVVKSNSDCGGMVICPDKSKLNLEEVMKEIVKKSKRPYSDVNKEYPYQYVKQHYFAEEYKEDKKDGELRDYKFFCFDGVPKFLFVASDRGKKNTETKFDFFDLEWNHLPIINGHPNAEIPPSKPDNFEEMIDVARKLSKGIPHVRVDLYNANGNIYFGEMTFFHWSGTTPWEPIEWDYKFGEYIKLPMDEK